MPLVVTLQLVLSLPTFHVLHSAHFGQCHARTWAGIRKMTRQLQKNVALDLANSHMICHPRCHGSQHVWNYKKNVLSLPTQDIALTRRTLQLLRNRHLACYNVPDSSAPCWHQLYYHASCLGAQNLGRSLRKAQSHFKPQSSIRLNSASHAPFDIRNTRPSIEKPPRGDGSDVLFRDNVSHSLNF